MADPRGPQTATMYAEPSALIAPSTNTRITGGRIHCGSHPRESIAIASKIPRTIDSGVPGAHLGPRLSHIWARAGKQPAELLGLPGQPKRPNSPRNGLKLYGKRASGIQRVTRSANAGGWGAMRGPHRSMSFPIRLARCTGVRTLFRVIKNPACCNEFTTA